MSSERMDSTNQDNSNDSLPISRREVLKLLGAGAVVALTAGCSSEANPSPYNNSSPSEQPDRRETTGPGVSPEAFEEAQNTVTEQSIRSPYSSVSSAGLTIKALTSAIDKDGTDRTTVHNDDNGDTIMLSRTSSPEKDGVRASIWFNSRLNQVTFSLNFDDDSGTTSLGGIVQLSGDAPINTSSNDIPIPVVLTAIKDILNDASASSIEAWVQNKWKPGKNNYGYNLSLKFSDRGMYECRDGVTGSEETRITNDIEARNAASRYCEIADGAYKIIEKAIQP